MTRSTAVRLREYIGGLTLSGGDHDGELLQLLPWEKRFLGGVFGKGKRGAAGLSRREG